MGAFDGQLAAAQPGDDDGRRWIYVACDQLSDRLGRLSNAPIAEAGIVLVESEWLLRRRPYHQQRLALVIANQRHFALEQARRGVAVRYLRGDGSPREQLEGVAGELGGLWAMRCAEREQRADLQPLVDDGRLELGEHSGWLSTGDDFDAVGEPPWRIDAFYRRLRQRSGILMEAGSPVGGKYSHDADNREAWSGEPAAPEPPRFGRDDIRDEVARSVAQRFADHPGRVDVERLPATKQHAKQLWQWALDQCMEHFGPYEDAMSTRSRGIFHTRISPLLNLHRLLPANLLADVLELDIPLNSKEGFVRQLLGWREFMRHVHERTDGFRSRPGDRPGPGVSGSPGDGGYAGWAGGEYAGSHRDGDPDGGARPDALGQGMSIPPAFWGKESGLRCLDRVVADVWEEAWSHHITRLMVLGNLASLLDISPRDLADWFWVAYADAWDWVVEPNVLGMATWGLGGLYTTKPYVSGSAYIDRMSDYCQGCRFDPKKDCPIRRLYWAFLARHEGELRGNPRLNMPYRSLDKRDRGEKKLDVQVFDGCRRVLAAGGTLEPGELPA